MNKEILNLAKECGFDVAVSDREYNLTVEDWSDEIEAFYRATAIRKGEE